MPAKTTRQQLVEAAIEVVARKGFHAASVNEIVGRAGFSIGALYWNFSGKDELFLAVFDEHIAWFERWLEKLSASTDPTRTSAEWLDFIAKHPDQQLIFIEFWAYAVREPKVRKEFAKRMAHMRTAITEVIRRKSQERGVAPPLPLETTGLLALALSRGLVLEKLVDKRSVSDDTVRQVVAGLLGAD